VTVAAAVALCELPLDVGEEAGAVRESAKANRLRMLNMEVDLL